MRTSIATMGLLMGVLAGCSSSSTSPGTTSDAPASTAETSTTGDEAGATDAARTDLGLITVDDTGFVRTDTPLPKLDVDIPEGALDCAGCMKTNCMKESLACGSDSACVAASSCLAKCSPGDTGCPTKCIADNPSKAMDALLACAMSKCSAECPI